MTSYSGLWNNEYGENHSLLSDDESIGNSRTSLSKLFANRLYGRAAIREIIHALIGDTAGETALAEHKRVRSERDLEKNVLGGKRVIETFTSVDRATTNDDADKIKQTLRQVSTPAYPVDRAGNGGGNKLGW